MNLETVDKLLTTTRSVRRRLDLMRTVDPRLVAECLEIAVQAPTGSNSQGYHFVVVTDAANAEQKSALAAGKIIVKDVIADIVFQQTITRAREFDVIATMNLNGDYLSDALAAQVGGIGIAPGGNINYETGHAVFEATHGTAPKYAGLDRVNPGSVILSGEMMLRYMGWKEAADLIIRGVEGAVAAGTVTYDFARMLPGSKEVKCSEFGDAVIHAMADATAATVLAPVAAAKTVARKPARSRKIAAKRKPAKRTTGTAKRKPVKSTKATPKRRPAAKSRARTKPAAKSSRRVRSGTRPSARSAARGKTATRRPPR